MDIDAQIRALEDQVARETEELDRARQARPADNGAAGAFGGYAGSSHGSAPAGPPAATPHHQVQDASAGADGKAPPRFEKDSDDRSIFIQGIPNHADITPEMVAEGFADCGQVLKCTLLRDRATGALKGGAYIEFATYEGVGRAIDTKQNITFRGANLTVSKKRSLFNPTRARGRGAGDRGGFRGRGAGAAVAQQQEMMASMMGMMMGAMASMGANRGGSRGGRGGPSTGGRGAWRGGGGGGDAVQNADAGARGRGGYKPF